MIALLNSDARRIPLSDQSVQCIITSPPYYGLRDYGTATWEGGSAECEHRVRENHNAAGTSTLLGGKDTVHYAKGGFKDICPRCGAVRIDAQIGLEASPAAYVASIVAVMRECWRVLKDDGVMWLNLGDSYAMSSLRGNSDFSKTTRGAHYTESGILNTSLNIPDGLKPKDLIGIPWRVAFALQDDGWYLRQDIIWSKKNCMPESVTDRCTKSHEYIFLLTKSPRYFYDNIAIQEVDTEAIIDYNDWHENETVYQMQEGSIDTEFLESEEGEGRPFRLVQGMLFGELEEVGEYSTGETFEKGSRSEIQDEQARQGETSGIQSVREDVRNKKAVAGNGSGKGVSEKVSSVREAQGSPKAICNNKEIQGEPKEVSNNGQGTRKFIEGSTQAPVNSKVDNFRSDIRSMGSNQKGSELSLRDMREEEGTDEGSHYSSEQGRPAYSKEHSGTMPIMQQQKGKQVIRSRNKRSVWSIATQPFSGAHFATFPPKLIEPMILAGSRVNDIVFDPFAGTATVGRVAIQHGRRFVGGDLNTKYITDLAPERTSKVQIVMSLGGA